jgi:hypothetical protein
MKMPSPKLPKHLNGLKGHDLRQATVRFKLRYAALMTTPEASIRALGAAIGVQSTVLSDNIKYGYVDGYICVKLEKYCGRAEFPRQWFNPELYENATAEA